MSLIGFDHVFTHALAVRFGQGIQYKVAAPTVLALLKMVSYLDDPHGRRRDLIDLRVLLGQYEANSGRIFGDDVFAAELEDIEYANAFLLGKDVGGFAVNEETEIVHAFLRDQCSSDEQLSDFDAQDVHQKDVVRFQKQLRAFRKGFDQKRQNPWHS